MSTETSAISTGLDALYGTSLIEAGDVQLQVRKVLTRENQRNLSRLRRRVSTIQSEVLEIRKRLVADADPSDDTHIDPSEFDQLIDKTEALDDEVAPLHWECIKLLCVDPPEVLAESSADALSNILVGALLSQMKAVRTIIKEDNPDHPLPESSVS